MIMCIIRACDPLTVELADIRLCPCGRQRNRARSYANPTATDLHNPRALVCRESSRAHGTLTMHLSTYDTMLSVAATLMLVALSSGYQDVSASEGRNRVYVCMFVCLRCSSALLLMVVVVVVVAVVLAVVLLVLVTMLVSAIWFGA